MNSKKGISLISLIITIIVIIILAAIVIFSGFGATESAEFARFTQEFSDYQERISQEYRNKKTNNAIDRIKKKDSEIYKEIAGGEEYDVNSLLSGETILGGLKGTKCYKIQDAGELYEGQTGIYITDKGEVFTLPGYEYATNNETHFYVTSSKYYLGDGIVSGGNSGGSAGTGGTSTGEPVEMTGAPTVEGTIAVGDYVEYTPDSGEYTNNEVPAGESSGDYYLGHQDLGILTTDTATKWRVVRINDGEGETGEILITPADAVNTIKIERRTRVVK